jgi:hypothetical protein
MSGWQFQPDLVGMVLRAEPFCSALRSKPGGSGEKKQNRNLTTSILLSLQVLSSLPNVPAMIYFSESLSSCIYILSRGFSGSQWNISFCGLTVFWPQMELTNLIDDKMF